MNRPIKFRAWDFHDKEYLEVYEIYIDGDGIPHYDTPQMGLQDATGDVEIMQFTGLTDKNGTDIYEGDIVEHNLGILGLDIFNVIQARSGEWRIENDRGGSVLAYSLEDVEVIGNIYENPELLGDSQ